MRTSNLSLARRTAHLIRGRAAICLGLLCGIGLSSALAAADAQSSRPTLTVSQIIEKHIAARGGASAWHGVRTLSMLGKIEAGTPDSIARSERLALGGLGASIKKGGA